MSRKKKKVKNKIKLKTCSPDELNVCSKKFIESSSWMSVICWILVPPRSKIKQSQIHSWDQMTGWSRQSKAQPCMLVDLHHTSWQRTGTMINSAASENEDRCVRLQMSAHFTASEIRFFWSCLLLLLAKGVLIVLLLRTDLEKGRNIKSLWEDLLRLMMTPMSDLSADKINGLLIDLSFFSPNHIFVRQEKLVSRFKLHKPDWGNDILLLLLRTVIVSLKRMQHVCRLLCNVFQSEANTGACHRWTTGELCYGCRAFPAAVGLLDTPQRTAFLF